MKALLLRLDFSERCDEKAPDHRLRKLVARERAAVADAAQQKLSRQADDPAPQEDVIPLYHLSVYVSSGARAEHIGDSRTATTTD